MMRRSKALAPPILDEAHGVPAYSTKQEVTVATLIFLFRKNAGIRKR